MITYDYRPAVARVIEIAAQLREEVIHWETMTPDCAEALAAGLYEAEREEAHRKTEQTQDVVETEIGYHAAIATATTKTKGE